MPNRIIKDSVRQDERIDRLNWFEEVVFYRLIVTVDDFGCYDGRISVLKNTLFPAKDNVTKKAVEDAISKLASVGLLCRYTVNGKPYVSFPKWERHQRIRNKVRKYPEPPDFDSSPSIDGQMTADCPLESNPIQSNPESVPNAAAASASAAAETDFFEALWKQYPRKEGKSAVTKKALAEIQKAGYETLAQAIDNYKEIIRRDGTEKRYILHGSTFFNGRWRDYAEGQPDGEEDDLSEPEYVYHNGERIRWTLDYPCPIGRGLTPDECEALGVAY
jgi:hypothetical protein